MSICHIICLGLVVSMCHPKWLGPSDVWTRAAAWSAGYRVLRSAWKFYTAYRTPLSNSVPRNQSSEQRLLFGIGTRGYMLATCHRIPFICCCFAKRNQKHTIGKSISSARPSDWNSRLGACGFPSDFFPCCGYVERKIDASHWKLSKQRLLFRTGTRS